MDIDQTGNNAGAFQIHAVLFGNIVQNFREFSILHPKAAMDKGSIRREDLRILKQHGRHLRIPAGWQQP